MTRLFDRLWRTYYLSDIMMLHNYTPTELKSYSVQAENKTTTNFWYAPFEFFEISYLFLVACLTCAKKINDKFALKHLSFWGGGGGEGEVNKRETFCSFTENIFQ